ncbi:MAG: hypothetical protein FWE98_00595 [Oscillospiraceae bacterium]|nr:hypothetical protein [Oscillospiraceae bacterium]
MKKALSILLTLALALGLGVCPLAAKEPMAEPGIPGASMFQSFDPALAAFSQSLTFELPTVTKIEAVWDGEIDGLFYGSDGPYFNAENVAVTVTFEDGGSETLTGWWAEGPGWWWQVFSRYNEQTGIVTLYYSDSNLYKAYIDSLADPEKDYNWRDYRATLPQTTFIVPIDLREQYFKSLYTDELKLGESKAVTLEEGEQKVFAFTPEEDGYYRFYSLDNSESDPYGYLYGPKFEFMKQNDDGGDLNFSMTAWLKAGKTYYLCAYSYNGRGGGYKVAVTTAEPPGDPEFRLYENEYKIRYGTYKYIYPHWFIDWNDFEGVLVNGKPLYDDFDSATCFYVEGTERGKIMTLTYTTADGETVLGTVDIVCTFSPLQWVSYYLLGGFLWMPRLEAVYAYDIIDFNLWELLMAVGAGILAPILIPALFLWLFLQQLWFGR